MSELADAFSRLNDTVNMGDTEFIDFGSDMWPQDASALQQLIVDMHEAHARTEAALDRAVTVVNEALNLDGTRFKFTYLDFVEDNLAPEAPTPEAE